MKIKVSQLENKNQFIIENKHNVFFQSYDSVCARYNKKTHTLYVNKDYDYSNTTRKHFYIFINEYVCVSAIENALYSKNKRKAIKQLIKAHVIKIDKELD